MPKESHDTLPGESSNVARVLPYLRRSARINKDKEPELPVDLSEWEDVQCVICMEPPHNAVQLTCSSFESGCRPYMCDTSVRHSNCYKQYLKMNRTRQSTNKILSCPLCRGKVLKTKKVTTMARTFMNEKPRSCAFDDCEFSGTHAELCKHLKDEHRGLIPRKVDLETPWRWDQDDAGWLPRVRIPDVVDLPVVQLDIMTGNVRHVIRPINLRNVFGLPDDNGEMPIGYRL